jgi:four helix bundle protein
MNGIKKFEDLRVWQSARELCKAINEISNKNEFSRNFSLKDQIRRSSGSAMDNIAEGYGRDGNAEFKQFLAITKGSLCEVKSQLYRALDYKYISTDEFETLYKSCDKTIAGVSRLMFYLKDSKIKGAKFN